MCDHLVSECVDDLIEKCSRVNVFFGEFFPKAKNRCGIGIDKCRDDCFYEILLKERKIRFRIFFCEFFVQRVLFEKRECIAQSSSCRTGNDLDGFFFRVDAFGFDHIFETVDDRVVFDFVEVEFLCS